MSTHKIEIIEIKILPHPNADKLGIVQPFGYTVCVDKTQWKDGDLAAYIPPDYLVPLDKPEFSWLKDPKKPDATKHHIKVKKLRGVISQGLLVPAPSGSKLGDDVLDILGVVRYEPPEPSTTRGQAISGPDIVAIPKYDVENWQRYKHILKIGEQVVVTEKIHGCNSRYVYHDGQFWCGSRSEWKQEAEDIIWWKYLKRSVQLQQILMNNPSRIFYGELYGQVQDLKYGAAQNELFFRVFDIRDAGNWMEWDNLTNIVGDMVVPVLYKGPYTEELSKYAEGQSTLAGHVREGCVIRSVPERTDIEIGRVQLKIVGNGYLER